MPVHRHTCSLCEAQCGLRIETQNGAVIKLEGDPDDVLSRGYVCPKAFALQDLHNDPDRLRQPMLRKGNTWREIGWEEALTLATNRLTEIREQHGSRAIATYVGNPNVHHYDNLMAISPFTRAIGGRNRFSATSSDQLPHMFAAYLMFGHQFWIPVPDVDRTQHLIIIGGNPLVSNGSLMTAPNMRARIKGIQARGGKVIVFDPNQTMTAKKADAHFFVRPGTDALLLLAWVHTIFEEQYVSEGPWRSYTEDLDTLKALSTFFTPEKIADTVGIAAPIIRNTIRDFIKAPSSALYGRIGICTQRFGGLCAWLINAINILAGRLDTPGGVMFPTPAVDVRKFAGQGHFDIWRSRVRGLPEFGGELPSSCLAEEIDTPGADRIRALVTVAGNPVLSTPEGPRLSRALETLDFMVSLDMYRTETTRHAHLILPTCSPLEREHFALAFNAFSVRNTVKFNSPIFEKPPGAKSDYDVMVALTQRLLARRSNRKSRMMRWGITAQKTLGPKATLDLGLRIGPYGSGANPFGSGLSLKKVQAQPGGIDLGPMQPQFPEAIQHRNKKIRLVPDAIAADVTRLQRTFSEGDFGQSKQLLLIGRRHLRSNNSWLQNQSRLSGGTRRCTVQIHPDDAQARTIHDGTLVEVHSRVGSVTLPAEITDRIMQGVVSIPHGWGHQSEDTQLQQAKTESGVNANALTDGQFFDELTGNAGFNGVPVTITLSSTEMS